MSEMQAVEIRCFGKLRRVHDERQWPVPYYYTIKKECSAAELVQMLNLSEEEVEAVFINGNVTALEKGRIKPGDRVGIIPFGTPGAVRLLLGIKQPQKE
ncbi:pyruvate kinase [Dethiobacter alkaliphilus]|uniref:ThiamineS protein n=1 Tax=Dethiobacter alkaliphilus AHT 1 TaxID=555088 RepID=C0GJY5_DETAL|nr:MoaD/ThiS family protein [Dethiobacter alkaliphilus]EEG76354.1 conserved hypothetical protein [Dethiobacter alkaliphilus AHT 1]